MYTNPLGEQTLQLVHELMNREGWQLSAENSAAFIEDILVYIQAVPNCSDREINKIALNYYEDGPMVQMMLDHQAVEGERYWREWRHFALKWARAKGLAIQDAEDLVQVVELKARSAIVNFQFRSRFQTFLGGIFTNCYKEWLRKTRNIREREKLLDDQKSDDEEQVQEGRIEELGDDAPALEKVLVHAEIRQLIEAEILSIVGSHDFRILYWYYVERAYVDETSGKAQKWTDEAIAAQLGMTLNGATTRRDRAVRRLAEALIDHMGKEEVVNLVGQEDCQILSYYYIEKRYTDRQTGKRRRWTDRTIGQQLALSVPDTKSRRHEALREIAYTFLCRLLGLE